MRIHVPTPNGNKFHGVMNEDTGAFTRKVSYKKDRLRIFDAWSVHPKIIEKAKGLKLKTLVFIDETKTYTISLEDALQVGFEKEFSGGKTFYIQLKHFKIT